MTSNCSFTFFDTEIGYCGIAWGEQGIVAVQLPEENEDATRSRLLHRFPLACAVPPPPEIQLAIDAVTALLVGQDVDLSMIRLDMREVPPFHLRVYVIARAIPCGATLSYGDIAMRLGMPGSAQAVGQALGKNPFPIVVPCHRVLAAGRKSGGFSGAGGVSTKLRLLLIERARIGDQPELF